MEAREVSAVRRARARIVSNERLTARAHRWLRTALRPGDLAVDATAGNGHDTALLAECVGSHGRVLAMDVQAAALDATQKRLLERGLLDQRVQLILEDHGEIARHVGNKRPKAAVWNLGYLPGSDRTVTTRAERVLRSLRALSEALVPGGALVVVAYLGHPGGRGEASRVLHWLARLGPLLGLVWIERARSPAPHGPRLWVLARPPLGPLGEAPGNRGKDPPTVP